MKSIAILLISVPFLSFFYQNTNHLIVVDGVATTEGIELLNQIPIDRIDSIYAIDSEIATRKYGSFLGHRGIIFINTKFDFTSPLQFQNDLFLTYGDKNPITVFNGEVIEYDKIEHILERNTTILFSRNINLTAQYGPQAINGVIHLSSKQ